ncbi:MAG: CAP domain-containing protein [Bacteroidales bacterium]|nr:CAP domain-containing protein [Bacteroidales bacterium]
MKRLLFLLSISCFVCTPLFSLAQNSHPENVSPQACLTTTEQYLAKMINAYRVSEGLPALPYSYSLSLVAGIHCQDLYESYTHSGRCNLHSWSDKGSWTSCCYTDDHKKAECIWNKPRELTSYQGDGFEIAYYTTRALEDPKEYASDILESWKGSPGHNAVIINKGIWKSVEWNAMGIGIVDGYATVWFGKLADPAGVPDLCEDN